MPRVVDLSHELVANVQTYSWLPAPRLSDFISREESRGRYADGVSFVLHQFEFIGNSGTYLDAPLHRHADGLDLADLPLERLANLPALVIDAQWAASRAIDAALLDGFGENDLQGAAVLFHTGRERLWGSEDYPLDGPFVGEALAQLLVERGVALVGLDALNIDDMDDARRPAHTILLGAGIPIVENLCRLGELPRDGSHFFAVPARFSGGSAFPVRAFAVV